MIKLLGSQNTADVSDRFAAEKFQLTLTERDSTCTITVGPTAPEISVGAWLQDEDDPGAGIVWRVRSVQTDYKTQTRTIQCEHAIMALKDFLMFGEITPAVITGNPEATVCTAEETFRYILSHQSIWRFGSVLYNDTQAYNFNGDDLYTAMETITATIPNAWWSYDFSRVPYVISIVEKPESYIGQLSELRMDRNMKSLSVTVDRSRMYTRFYPIGRNNLMLAEKYVGRNENLYGITSQTETDENRTTEADLRKWANERLDNHAEPQVTISVNAMDLSAITGEDLDNFVLGAHCTVALPEYNTTIYERIMTLQWPDKVRDPMGVTITMANRKEDLTRMLAKEKKKTSTGRRSSAVSVSKSLKDVTLSGPTDNVYTLKKVLTNGTTEDIGTFSRAVTSWVVDVPTGGTIRVTAKPQDQSKSIQIGQGAGSWSDNTYTGLITYSDDDAAHWFSSGKWFTVDATSRYEAGKVAGWGEARDKVSPPTATQTENAYFDFYVPSTTYGDQSSYRYTVSCDDNYGYIKNASNTTVARCANNAKYTGWNLARTKLSNPGAPDPIPEADLTDNFDVGIPAADYGGASSYHFSLTIDDNYAYAKNSLNRTIARKANGAKYTGWDLARSKLSNPGAPDPIPVADLTDNFDVGIPAADYGGDSSYHFSLTIDDDYAYCKNSLNRTIARKANTSKITGWDLARSKLSNPGAPDPIPTADLTDYFDVGIPAADYGGASSYHFTVTVDDDYAYAKNSLNRVIARKANGAKVTGWNAARDNVDPPTTEQTTNAYFDFFVPALTYGDQSSYRYTVSCDDTYCYIKNAVNTIVARCANTGTPSAIDGWNLARDQVFAPSAEQTTNAYFDFYVPAVSYGDQSSYRYTVGNNIDYVYITNAVNTVIARKTNTAKQAVWDLARNQVGPPTEEQTTYAYFDFYVPAVSYGDQSSYRYTVSNNENYVYILNAANTVVARKTNTAKEYGWAVARNEVGPPAEEQLTYPYFDFYVPGEGYGTQGSYRYTVSCDSSYCYIKNAVNTIVARCANTGVTHNPQVSSFDSTGISKSSSGAASYISGHTKANTGVLASGHYYNFTVKCGSATKNYYIET